MSLREKREKDQHVPEGDVTLGTLTTSSALSKHNTRTHTPCPHLAHCSVVELEAPTHPFLYLTHFPVNTVDAGEPSLFPLGWKTLAEWEKEGSGRTGAVEDELKGGGKYQGE